MGEARDLVTSFSLKLVPKAATRALPPPCTNSQELLGIIFGMGMPALGTFMKAHLPNKTQKKPRLLSTQHPQEKQTKIPHGHEYGSWAAWQKSTAELGTYASMAAVAGAGKVVVRRRKGQPGRAHPLHLGRAAVEGETFMPSVYPGASNKGKKCSHYS